MSDIKNIDEIVIDSVGVVNEISEDTASVYFIGLSRVVKVNPQHIEYLDVTKTGKGYDKKICNICHILKDENEFAINQTDAKTKKTRRPSCKFCRKKIDGNAIKRSEGKRLDKLKPEGIFTCPICKKTSIVGITAKLVRDHDHLTGNGREWICDSCNTGLGRFQDKVELLRVVISYLEKFN